ncbi:hypothetical protein V8C35DRAFT_280365 [Trichoderma chlorosporum]
MRINDYVLYTLTCAGAVAGQTLGQPSLSYLGFMNMTLGTFLTSGDTGLGQQVTIPVTGGTISGPKVNGKVLTFGADWGLLDSSGIYHPDVRINIQTYDGALIYVQAHGSEQANSAAQATNLGVLRVKFETGYANYTWLNDIAATAIYELLGPLGASTGILVDVWETTPPPIKA